jgi:hypothetical protein
MTRKFAVTMEMKGGYNIAKQDQEQSDRLEDVVGEPVRKPVVAVPVLAPQGEDDNGDQDIRDHVTEHDGFHVEHARSPQSLAGMVLQTPTLSYSRTP